MNGIDVIYVISHFHGGNMPAMKKDAVVSLNPTCKAVICQLLLQPAETAVIGHNRPI